MESVKFNMGDKVMLKLDNNIVLVFIEEVGDNKAKCVNIKNEDVILHLATIEPYAFHSFL